MSTAFLMFSIFLTGAIICNKDNNASNTLLFFALLAGLTGLGMWAAQAHLF